MKATEGGSDSRLQFNGSFLKKRSSRAHRIFLFACGWLGALGTTGMPHKLLPWEIVLVVVIPLETEQE